MQIYALKGETLKILAEYESFYLTMKRDGVIGWIEQKFVKKDLSITSFPKLVSKLQSPLSFFEEWLATPYRWGGVSKLESTARPIPNSIFLKCLIWKYQRTLKTKESLALLLP